MEIEIVGVDKEITKKACKFGYHDRNGVKIFYKNTYADGHGFFYRKDEKDVIIINRKIRTEVMYEKLSNIRHSDIKEYLFKEEKNDGNYILNGVIEFVYHNFDIVELIRIKCYDFEIYADNKEFDLNSYSKGDYL